VSEDAGKFFGYPVETLRRYITHSSLGIMKINTYVPPANAEWGRFNDRKVDLRHIKNLALAFVGAMDNMSEESSMDMIVHPDWVANLGEALGHGDVDGLEHKDLVPEIKFTESGVRETEGKNLWVTSGNHRRIAQYIAINQLKLLIEEKRAEEKTILDGWKDKDPDRETKEDLSAIADRIRALEAKITRMSFWTVKMYNKSEGRARAILRSRRR